MTIPHRREPERLVLPGVLVVADADEGCLQQANDGGDDLFPGEAVLAQILIDALANARQRAPERDHVLVFRLVADLPPFGVIAVLLATARIAAGGLDVAVRRGADPDVG